MPIHGAPPGEVGYTDDEIDMLSMVGHLAAMFSPSEVLTLIRVIGGSLSRIAEAAVSLFLVDVETPHLQSGMSELELARKVFDAAGLVDGLTARLDPVLRRQIQQAVERNRRSTIGASERLQYRYAVGFVDLVGFTALLGRLPAEELATFLGRFEADAHDVVAHHGARVVKLIGDEVMFVATDAAIGLRGGARAGRRVLVGLRGRRAAGRARLRQRAAAGRRLLRHGGQPRVTPRRPRGADGGARDRAARRRAPDVPVRTGGPAGWSRASTNRVTVFSLEP